jgi:hypothetical protein
MNSNNKGENMIQLILKTLVRALLIFLPVAYLSSKGSSVGQQTSLTFYGMVVIVILVFSLMIAVVWFAKSRRFQEKIKSGK